MLHLLFIITWTDSEAHLGSAKGGPQNEKPNTSRGVGNEDEVYPTPQLTIGVWKSVVNELPEWDPARALAKNEFGPLCRRQKANGSSDFCRFWGTVLQQKLQNTKQN